MSHVSPAQQRGNTKTHKWQLKQSPLETHSALPCTHSEMWGGPNQKTELHGGSRPERDGHHPVRPPSRPLQSPTQSRPEPLPPEMGAVIHVTCFSSTTATATQSHNRLQRHLYTDQFSSRTWGASLLAERFSSRTGRSSPYAENPTIGS